MTALWDQVCPRGLSSSLMYILISLLWGSLWPICTNGTSYGATPWNLLEFVLKQSGFSPCIPPQTSDTHGLQAALSAYRYAGVVQANCCKLEISTRFGTCIAVTDISFEILSWRHVRSYLNLIALIYERAGSKLDVSHGASQKATLSLPFPYLRAFPVVCKDHFIFHLLH